jgi:hypothetical protein
MVLKRKLYMAYCVKDEIFFEGVAWQKKIASCYAEVTQTSWLLSGMRLF